MKNSINRELKKPITADFSAGLYDWSMFLSNFYLRVKQVLKIDYESIMILRNVKHRKFTNLLLERKWSLVKNFRFEIRDSREMYHFSLI